MQEITGTFNATNKSMFQSNIWLFYMTSTKSVGSSVGVSPDSDSRGESESESGLESGLRLNPSGHGLGLHLCGLGLKRCGLEL